MTANPPKVGDVLRSNGQEWIVVVVENDGQGKSVVTLQPIDGQAVERRHAAS